MVVGLASIGILYNSYLGQVSEEKIETVFQFVVSAVSVSTRFYFFVIASTIRFELNVLGTSGTTDLIIRERLLQGQVPPALKMALTLPFQAIPMGMDVTIAKRVTIANFFVVTATLAIIFFFQKAEQEACFCRVGEGSRHKIFFQDLLLLLYAVSVEFISLAPGLKIIDEYNKTLRVDRLADSVLNHILKNSIAGAACLLEMETEETMSGSAPPSGSTAAPAVSARLSRALEQLHKTMEWCVNRQVMVDLASSAYRSTFSACCAEDFLARIAASCTGKASFTVVGCRRPKEEEEEKEQAAVAVSPLASRLGRRRRLSPSEANTVQFDVAVAEVALANALSNASEHGDTSHPVELSSEIREDASSSSKAWVHFRVENSVRGEALTNDALAKAVPPAHDGHEANQNNPKREGRDANE